MNAIRKHYVAYLFIAVPVLSTVVFLLIPMIVSLWWSFTDFSGTKAPVFIGLNNYIQLLTDDPVFFQALKNTAVFTFVGMMIGPSLALLVALMLNQNVRFRAFFRTAYFLPVMTSLVVVATIWRMLYNRSGLMNQLLAVLGLASIRWLSDPHWSLMSIIITSVWQGFGFEMVIFLAALQSIPKELYEAAAIDGADGWQRLIYITLPGLRPVLLYVFIIGIIGGFQVFDQVFIMTAGGPLNSSTTLVYYLYTKFMDLRLGYASAIAYVLFIILVVFSYIQWRYFRERD